MACAAGSAGSIRLYIGAMFACKSSSLCDDIERYRIANKKCVIVCHSLDNRYDHLKQYNGLVTHRGAEFCKVKIISADNLTNLYDTLLQYDVIGIDELQFFRDLNILHDLANAGKKIICAGLDGDDCGNPFGSVCQFIPKCEEVIKLKAVCMKCFEPASFTQRINCENKDLAPNAQSINKIEIGGAEKYIAVCRSCMKWPAQ